MDNLLRAVASATCDFKYRSKPSPSSSVIPVSNLSEPKKDSIFRSAFFQVMTVGSKYSAELKTP
jgi:hypothetical protein